MFKFIENMTADTKEVRSSRLQEIFQCGKKGSTGYKCC